MNILPIQPGSIRQFAVRSVNSSSSTHGVAFSHEMIGGYTEFPSLLYRNDIPIGDEMNKDGMSSGRRKYGMVVYVAEENKYFQLIPLSSDPATGNTIRVDYTLWATLTDAVKMVLLDPTKSRDDVFNFPISTGDLITGSGNPDDAWKELFFWGLSDMGAITGLTAGNISGNLTVTGNVTATSIQTQTKIKTITADPYTFDLSDQSALLLFDYPVETIVYIPTDVTANFPIGAEINFSMHNTGVVRLSADPSVSVRAADGRDKLRVQHSTATVLKLSANDWLLFGDIWSDSLD